ncbi:MAG: metal ABC transporter substrate-binding protein [Alphaproteobacteria bacterium]|nr:metal ABC transporter substrate-binding protein [Alphaproteobacteria bacterium]
MKLIGVLVAALLAGEILAVSIKPAHAAEKIAVVATFSILADMAKQVGGERVAVHSMVGPGSDAHVFQATPADAVTLRRAALVVENGFGFEGWLDRLIEAADYKGQRIVASEGVAPLSQADTDDHGHHQGDKHGLRAADPHAWQNIANGVHYVDNIARGLCNLDKSGCPTYKANGAAYIERLQALDREIKGRLAAIPSERRKVITSHSAFGYFAERYGVEIIAPEGVSTEQEAAALDVAGLIRQIREHDIKALFVENISDPRLIEQIARETGLKPAGRLYSDALSKAGGEADSYIAMMRHNGVAIAEALEAAGR